jgi:hypothetical protein
MTDKEQPSRKSWQCPACFKEGKSAGFGIYYCTNNECDVTKFRG